MGYYSWDSTFDERQSVRRMREAEYLIYKRQWSSITPLQESHFRKFRDRRHAVQKDVMRTDRTETFFAPLSADATSNHYEPEQNAHLSTLHDVLLTYTFFNFDIGYW